MYSLGFLTGAKAMRLESAGQPKDTSGLHISGAKGHLTRLVTVLSCGEPGHMEREA